MPQFHRCQSVYSLLSFNFTFSSEEDRNGIATLTKLPTWIATHSTWVCTESRIKWKSQSRTCPLCYGNDNCDPTEVAQFCLPHRQMRLFHSRYSIYAVVATADQGATIANPATRNDNWECHRRYNYISIELALSEWSGVIKVRRVQLDQKRRGTLI